MSERLTLSISDQVATITLDDGKVNVMSTEMLDDINKALDQVGTTARAVVLRSSRPGIFRLGLT